MSVAPRSCDLALSSVLFALKPPARAAAPTRETEPALLPATGVHPIAVAIPVGAAAWFVEVAWCAFGGGETSLVLAVITFFCLIFFGLFVGGAALGRDMTPERARERSCRSFLDGDVDIATGRITGREALWQIAAMPVALAIGFTTIALIAVTV